MPLAVLQVVASRYGGWIALAAGAACSLAFAPTEWFGLSIACPAILWLLWEDAAPRRAARLGFAFGAGLFLAGTYWIYTAVHVYGKAPIWLALFLMLALVAIMATYYALLGWIAARFLPAAGALRWLAGLPAGWVLLEWLRGWLFSGFPWLELGYAHSDSPLAGYDPVGGVHLVTLACVLTVGALVTAICGSARERVAALVIAAAVWTGGAALTGKAWTEPVGGPISVAIIQGATPQDLKWQASNRQKTLDLYRRLTEENLGTRLIIWPEAALPVLANEVGPYLANLWQDAEHKDSDLVMGLLRYDERNDRYYNGVLALSGDKASWYYKRRLVPFGEFFPVPAFMRRWMRLMSLAYVDMTPGAEDQPPLPVAGQEAGVTICYEDAYGAEQLAVLNRATLLINATNNAWFGDSTAPHQQLQMARFRALEAGRYLARATSNGITAIIGPDGGILERAPQFVTTVLKGSVIPFRGLTPYARTGNWPVLTASLLLLLAAAGWRLRSPTGTTR